MSTPAIYTFKGASQSDRPDIHLVYHSDGYPRGAADLIPDLASVAYRIQKGEDIDLESLDLPNIDSVQRRSTVDLMGCPTPFRYIVETIDGRLHVTALRHEPVIPEELERRLESARSALQAVEREMEAARKVPTYAVLGKGDLKTIRALGSGYHDEE